MDHKTMKRSNRALLYGALFGILVGGAWVGVRGSSVPSTTTRVVLEPADEFVFRLIVSSACTFSAAPDLPALIEGAAESVRRGADEIGLRFVTAAVAIDLETAEGLEFLRRFGRFDEVAAGRWWLNSALLSEPSSPAASHQATPQVVLLRRTVESVEHDGGTTVPLAMHSSVVARFLGAEEIGRLMDPAFVRRLVSVPIL